MNVGFAVVLLCALTDWFAVARENKRLEYFFKPATMVALIGATLLSTSGPHDAYLAVWVIVGLSLSLVGDVFLMLPAARWFLPGLVAFLLAHVAYIVGLNPTLPPPASILVLVPILVVGAAAAAAPIQALRARQHTSLILPVGIYALTITLMLYSAWATLFRPEWDWARRGLVIGGASLFFLSDTLLARNRFVQPFSGAKLAIIITYHLGQIALAASIAL